MSERGLKRSRYQENELLEYLTCEICLEYFSIPIYECPKGHSLCKKCFHKIRHPLPSCPICRARYPLEPARNYLIEEFLEQVPCNCGYCGTEVTLAAREKHEENCPLNRNLKCPFIELGRASCNWADDIFRLEEHLSRVHNLRTTHYGSRVLDVFWGKVLPDPGFINRDKLVKIDNTLIYLKLVKFTEHFELYVHPLFISGHSIVSVILGEEGFFQQVKHILGARSKVYKECLFLLSSQDVYMSNGIDSFKMKLKHTHSSS